MNVGGGRRKNEMGLDTGGFRKSLLGYVGGLQMGLGKAQGNINVHH